MPYQYNYNEKCDSFRKNQGKRKAIREHYRLNHASKSGLSI